MSEYQYHRSVHLHNFTVFRDATLEFVPGINVLVGENGTGKTHLMKALYAASLAARLPNEAIGEGPQNRRRLSHILSDLFQTSDMLDLVRQGSRDGGARFQGRFGDGEYTCSITRAIDRPQEVPPLVTYVAHDIDRPERPVFIPAIDIRPSI